jgi:nitroreductase
MVLDAIRKRRSIRQFTDDPVTDEQVRVLLEAAMAAPSANDSRPWQFVVVRDAGLRQQLSQTHPWSGMAAQSPVVFVVLAEEARSVHWVEDTAAATQNLLVQAAAEGLGTVWVAVHPHRDREGHVRKVLAIPSGLRVLCLVPTGHPARQRQPENRYDERRVHWDKY